MWIFLTMIVASVSTEVVAKSAMEYIQLANKNVVKKISKGNAKIIESDIIYRYPQSVVESKSNKRNAAVKFADLLWPGGVIPYTIDENFEDMKRVKKIIEDAIESWELNTCIRFVERTKEKDYIEFANNMGCNSDVGKHRGKQIVSLGNGCLHQSVAIHELGHVIGFWHEQNRPDRDNYVHINRDNVMNGFLDAFAKFSKYRINSLKVEYDYHSIMHYNMKAFSKNGFYTIVPKKKGVGSLGNDHLSALDIKQANLLYKCNELDLGWSRWSRWSKCNKTCEGGTQERIRVCRSAKTSAKKCRGAKVQKRVCNQQKCAGWSKFPSDFSFGELRRIDENTECLLIYEREDYPTWNSYYFCNRGKRAVKLWWSDEGPISGMKCTQIFEPKERPSKGWYDNYLCIPTSAPYNFTWSHSGKIRGKSCMQWYAKRGRDGWNDNFLCVDSKSEIADDPDKPSVPSFWSPWMRWSMCNKKCGKGKQMRMRVCVNSESNSKSKRCRGSAHERRECSLKPCHTLSCGGLSKGKKGVFTSPNYPLNYPNYLNCTWIIKGDGKNRIFLKFINFDVERLLDLPCKFDYLTIKDKNRHGKVLGKFCGAKMPSPILSDSYSLWVNFITDDLDSRSGFRAKWELRDSDDELTLNE